MQRITKSIKLNEGHSMQLVFDPLYLDDNEVDVNRLLFIDYGNLSAEVATFAIVIASFHFIMADLSKEVAMAELDLKTFKSKSKRDRRLELADEKKKYTIDEIDDYVRNLPMYRALNIKHINALHRKETIEGLYWSMKSKDDKLQKLSQTISSQDFINDLMNTSVKEMNYVKLRRYRPAIS